MEFATRYHDHSWRSACGDGKFIATIRNSGMRARRSARIHTPDRGGYGSGFAEFVAVGMGRRKRKGEQTWETAERQTRVRDRGGRRHRPLRRRRFCARKARGVFANRHRREKGPRVSLQEFSLLRRLGSGAAFDVRDSAAVAKWQNASAGWTSCSTRAGSCTTARGRGSDEAWGFFRFDRNVPQSRMHPGRSARF